MRKQLRLKDGVIYPEFIEGESVLGKVKGG